MSVISELGQKAFSYFKHICIIKRHSLEKVTFKLYVFNIFIVQFFGLVKSFKYPMHRIHIMPRFHVHINSLTLVSAANLDVLMYWIVSTKSLPGSCRMTLLRSDQIIMGSFMGRGNQYMQLVKVLYCRLLTIRKQLPTFPLKVRGLNWRPQRWEVSVLPLHHHGPASEHGRFCEMGPLSL